jgi:hypothetical protein
MNITVPFERPYRRRRVKNLRKLVTNMMKLSWGGPVVINSESKVKTCLFCPSLKISQSYLGGLVLTKHMEVICCETKDFPSLSLTIEGY